MGVGWIVGCCRKGGYDSGCWGSQRCPRLCRRGGPSPWPRRGLSACLLDEDVVVEEDSIEDGRTEGEGSEGDQRRRAAQAEAVGRRRGRRSCFGLNHRAPCPCCS